MPKENLGFVGEDIDNAKTYVSAVRGRVERGQLTNDHLESAQNYLTGVEAWRPHQSLPGIKLRQSGQVGALRKGVAADLSPNEDEIKGKISLTLTSDSGQVTLGKKPAKTLNPVQFAVLKEVAFSPMRRLSSKSIEELTRKLGFNPKYPARDAVSAINGKFQKALDNQSLIQREGPNAISLYLINPIIGMISEIEDQEKQPVWKYDYGVNLSSRILKVTERSTGEVSDVVADPDFDLLAKLMMSENEVLSAREVAKFCRERGGQGLMIVRQAVTRLRVLVKDDLDNPQVIVKTGKTKGAKYHFRGDFEITDGARDEATWKDTANDDTGPQVLQLKPQEELETDIQIAGSKSASVARTYVPYEATEDEKRSSDENKILKVVTGLLLLNRNIFYESMQGALHSADRLVETPTGQREIRTYVAKVIIEKFESGLGKFREEAEIPQLRKLWSEVDEEIWKNLQMLLGRHGHDVAEVVRCAKQEISKAKNRFLRDNPELHGQEPKTIKI